MKTASSGYFSSRFEVLAAPSSGRHKPGFAVASRAAETSEKEQPLS